MLLRLTPITVALLEVRDLIGARPHVYFGWTEGTPLTSLSRFVLFGDSDIAPVTSKVIRRAEPDPKKCPLIHVG